MPGKLAVNKGDLYDLICEDPGLRISSMDRWLEGLAPRRDCVIGRLTYGLYATQADALHLRHPATAYSERFSGKNSRPL